MKLGEVTIGNARLEVARWGAGRRLPILLLHEGLGSVRLWKGFPERLASASKREVIAWSRCDHGWSTPRASPRAPDYMHQDAEMLPALCKGLGLPRAHWLGHSDGASIALIAASRFPGLVSHLIVEAPHVFVEGVTLSSIGSLAAGFATSAMGERMKRYHRDPATLFHDWTAIWLAPAFRDWNIEQFLPGISAPTLIIQGHDDQYGSLEQLDRITAAVPDAVRLELKHCGHSPHFDREDAVIEAICNFLDGKE